jgi:tetratricopeptide (TPR) repeat protein
MTLPPQAGGRRSLFAISTIAILASVAALYLYGYRPYANAAASSYLAHEINTKLSALITKPRTVELTSEKAIRARHAIKQEDYSTAEKIIASVLTSSRVENWRFYPFADFIEDVVDPNDPAFEAKLTAWAARNESDAIPLLVRAGYYHDVGWLRRGHNFTGETPEANMERFRQDMDLAVADVEATIRLDSSNPYSFLLRLQILRGNGVSNEAISAFQTAIARYPGYYPLYETMLSMLQPKWGGDVQSMYGFVAQYAGSADESSPLKLLYVTLYRMLLETASSSCNSPKTDKDEEAQCTVSAMQAIVTKDLEHDVVRALHLYDRTDKYQFSLALQKIFSTMLRLGGDGYHAGALLELAAESMHSNTQLKQEQPGNNNYVIDKMIAKSWYVKGFYDNALQKDADALRDIEAMSFPSEEEKLQAIADIYQDMTDSYSALHRTIDRVAYQEAAIALGNEAEQQYYACNGYYQLKDYDKAIHACTRAIENAKDSIPAFYWRGVVYRDRGDAELSLRDFGVVAESQNDDLRSAAAIDLSMIYFGRNDNKSALDVLNRYKYLYDPQSSGKQNVAVSYNNRCYAYMQLGELDEALNDCTQSLKYGAIPEALRKQQELIKRLKRL